MTIANAVEEMKNEGKIIDVPYWRTIKADGTLNEKYPGGASAQKSMLEKEGFTIIQKGKKYLVHNYQQGIMI
jgi:alkylated DNA nucleotide flippase Atl1